MEGLLPRLVWNIIYKHILHFYNGSSFSVLFRAFLLALFPKIPPYSTLPVPPVLPHFPAFCVRFPVYTRRMIK